jgi:hypothetical protein
MRGHHVFAVVAAAAALGWAADAAAQRLGGRTPRDGACFYEDANYRGDYFCLETGDEARTMSSQMNDRISSIRIYGDAEALVYEDSRYRGDSERFSRDVRDLRGERWNDKISSVQVRESRGRDNRSGNSYRDTLAVDRIVRRAYEDILDREPDTAGLRLYRSRMIDDGWSEDQVRDALRDSPEYKDKNTMTRAKAVQIVRAAYLAVLGREPDPGASNYIDHVFKDKWTQADVERELRRSDEYRNRSR